MKKSEVILAWAPVGLYALLIFFFSALPGQNIPRPFAGADKLYHLLEYGLLALLLMRAWARMGRYSRIQALLATIFVVMLYALMDEFHQFFVPGRYASLLDWVADLAGGVLGGVLYRWRK